MGGDELGFVQEAFARSCKRVMQKGSCKKGQTLMSVVDVPLGQKVS